jgi:hypothetical protein
MAHRRPLARGLRPRGALVGGLLLLVVGGLAACGDAERVPFDEEAARALRAPVEESCERPYADDSPWNTPIPGDVEVLAGSVDIDGELTSNPRQYTYPVYYVGPDTPRRRVEVSGWFSNVVDDGERLVNQKGGAAEIPIPDGAEAAAGSDAQIILIDPATGDEWGASSLAREGSGFTAWNAYHYSTRWSGVPPYDEEGRPFWPRGAGVPYLTGLVRPCEIRRGVVDHALAFAYPSPSADHVWPATKSDGAGPPTGLPEGSRLQLDPTLDDADFDRMGCSGPCRTIARALQRYGMYVIDNSGRPKVMLEYVGTAGWDGLVDTDTVRPIPLSSFRVVSSGASG